MPKKLFALLIGINQYQARFGFPTLYGAEADVDHIQEYLYELKQDFDLQVLSLRGSKATKKNIVEAIQRHLGQAGSEDVALFYFSGHGLKEEAPEAFRRFESTPSIESLACYDSYAEGGVFGLANKELRYLLHKANRNQAHLAVITDCCHAAKITRGGLAPIARLAQPKKGKEMADQRAWSGFEFASQLEEAALAQVQYLEEVLPEAAHVHLAACQTNESAFEVGSGGIFTANMLEVLRQCNGAISYAELSEYTALLIRSRSRDYAQRPSVYTTKQQSLRDQSFLLASGRSRKSLVSVIKGEKEIRINRGLIHGIPSEEAAQNKTTIEIFESTATGLEPLASGKILSTDLSSSKILLLPTVHQLIEGKPYHGFIEGLYLQNFNVALWGRDYRNRAVFAQKFEQAFEVLPQEKPEATTDCVVMIEDRLITLAHPDSDYTTPQSRTFMPLTQSVFCAQESDIDKAIRQLNWVAQWHFVRKIQNQQTAIQTKDFDFTIKVNYGQGPLDQVLPEKGEYKIPIKYRFNSAIDGADLFFWIENKTNFPLYFNLIYLSQLFGIYPKVLNETCEAVLIAPGNTFQTSKKYGFTLENCIKDFNQLGENGIFRLFIAGESFNLSSLEQSDLEEPKKTKSRGRDEEGKGLVPKKTINSKDWAVFDYPILLLNPDYKA